MRSARTAVAGIIVGTIVLVITLIGVIGGFDKTSGGDIAVVRNGGWFDNKRIRQVVPARLGADLGRASTPPCTGIRPSSASTP